MTADVQRVEVDAPAASGRVGRLARAATAPLPLAVLLVVAVVSALSSVAGDSRWLALLGRHAFDGSPLSARIPHASAPTLPWPNVPLLAELVVRAVTGVAADRGLLALHVAAVAVGFAGLARTMHRATGARRGFLALLLLLLALGMLTTLLFIRLSLFSVALFPVELALLHEQVRRPSGRLWLLVPLLALWSNLHGAALVGLLVAGAYLLLHRARTEPLLAAAVALSSLAALLLLTPALWRTPVYYWRALHNEVAAQHVGLWARLSPTAPLDVLFLLSVAVCAVLVWRGRPRLWEAVALGGLALLTASAARHGAWLLMVAAVPAARGLPGTARAPRAGRPSPLALGTCLAALALLVVALVRGPLPSGASRATLDRVLQAAGTTPVLAEGQLAEQVADAGGQVWISNPLDAFTRAEQRRYVAWLETGDVRLVPPQVRVVLVLRDGTPADHLRAQPDFRLVTQDARTAVFARR
jgi:hypothetical protein